MDLTGWLAEVVVDYGEYAIILIAFFALVHPLTENPWSLFTLTMAITFLGIPLGYTVVLTFNLLGVILLYGIAQRVRRDPERTDSTILNKALNWLERTPMYKHIIVIGLPSVPTYPIKIALPFTNLSFSRYVITLMGSYLFLTVANSLIYFGVLGMVVEGIPTWLSVIMLITFALLLYFGKDVRRQLRTIQNKE